METKEITPSLEKLAKKLGAHVEFGYPNPRRTSWRSKMIDHVQEAQEGTSALPLRKGEIVRLQDLTNANVELPPVIITGSFFGYGNPDGFSSPHGEAVVLVRGIPESASSFKKRCWECAKGETDEKVFNKRFWDEIPYLVKD